MMSWRVTEAAELSLILLPLFVCRVGGYGGKTPDDPLAGNIHRGEHIVRSISRGNRASSQREGNQGSHVLDTQPRLGTHMQSSSAYLGVLDAVAETNDGLFGLVGKQLVVVSANNAKNLVHMRQ